MAALIQTRPQPPAPPRGELIDIGGRRLRVVIEGERGDLPLIVCEAGAFGAAADFAEVQAALSGRMRVLTYDRAGMGYSDPGPEPRDSHAITDDLQALLAALGEAPPYILVGHSMAGVHLHVFTLRWPQTVKGVVLLDAVPPAALIRPDALRFVKSAGQLAAVARTGAVLRLSGLTAPIFGNFIGVGGVAHKEKLHCFASPAHNHWAARELGQWLADGEAARDLGDYDRELPVAVVTAGRSAAIWKRLQAEPARRSRAGYVENVVGAGHASLLGPKYCQAVVRAVDFVLKAALASRH